MRPKATTSLAQTELNQAKQAKSVRFISNLKTASFYSRITEKKRVLLK